MKVEINEPKKAKEKGFPKLMIAKDGEMVLFQSLSVGTVIKGVEYGIGHHSVRWAMKDFSDFEGSITLSND